MLDYFAIFTKGGALLWTLQFTAALKHSPIDALNALVRGCLLEERASDAAFTYQPKTGAAQSLKWTFHNVRRRRRRRQRCFWGLGHACKLCCIRLLPPQCSRSSACKPLHCMHGRPLVLVQGQCRRRARKDARLHENQLAAP
jgi:hypothetical protein